jgi:hypothetical protein
MIEDVKLFVKFYEPIQKINPLVSTPPRGNTGGHGGKGTAGLEALAAMPLS